MVSSMQHLDARVPSGPLAQKWSRRVAELRLMAPARRSRYRVIVVGAGLAGCSLASTLAEQGYSVTLLTMLDSPRRSHSAAAQGGINACHNFSNDGDGVWRMFVDTLKGGDFRAREASVYRLAELSQRVIDHCVATGVPFARDYGGALLNRSFGGVQVSRTFYARGETGHQLLTAAHGSMLRMVQAGRIQLLTRREMLDLVLVEGRARGIVCRNLVTGQMEALCGDAVAIASGGYASIYYLSTNATHSNATALWRCHRRGALLANPSLVQFHPTCLPEVGEEQCKLTLMSEGLRNDGRCWVPRQAGDTRRPGDIPEDERDYFLERMYPRFGNLVPRDIASRAALEMSLQGRGVGPGGRACYLDFAGVDRERLKDRYGNLFHMYREITGDDPYAQPMQIAPAAHFSMGGLWVDYHLRSNLPGLFVVGEANCADHGANRLGANSLLQTLVDGLWIAPLTIADELTEVQPGAVGPDHPSFSQSLAALQRQQEQWLERRGTRTPRDYHRLLGDILRRDVGMLRNANGLQQAVQEIGELSQQFQQDLQISGSAGFNSVLEEAGRVADFLELGQLMARDALQREECCGAHFRQDLPERRDDERFATIAAWGPEQLFHEPLTFEELLPNQRSYE